MTLSSDSSVPRSSNNVAPREEFTYTRSRTFVNRVVRLEESEDRKARVFVGREGAALKDAHRAFDWAQLRGARAKFRDTGYAVRFADLFCGCGAMSLGARDACRSLGFEFAPELALDSDPAAAAVYSENLGPHQLLRTDITRVVDGNFGDASSAAERNLTKIVRPIDAVIAGPPLSRSLGLEQSDSQIRRTEHAVRAGRALC